MRFEDNYEPQLVVTVTAPNMKPFLFDNDEAAQEFIKNLMPRMGFKSESAVVDVCIVYEDCDSLNTALVTMGR